MSFTLPAHTIAANTKSFSNGNFNVLSYVSRTLTYEVSQQLRAIS